MHPSEKVAFLTALQKAVKPALDEARSELMEGMREADAERITLRLGGEEVGKATRKMPKPDIAPEVSDREAFMEFALCNGLASERKRIDPAMVPSVVTYLENNLDPDVLDDWIVTEQAMEDGWQSEIECRDGKCYLYGTDHEVPGLVPMVRLKPEGLMVTGCKPESVIPLVGSPEIAGLLGDAE